MWERIYYCTSRHQMAYNGCIPGSFRMSVSCSISISCPPALRMCFSSIESFSATIVAQRAHSIDLAFPRSTEFIEI